MPAPLPHRLLFDALAAARAALVARDERDVPAGLRKVRASSSRSLPPPLAKRLLSELETDAALREEAAALLPDAAGEASIMFLRRPDGWEEALHLLVEERTAAEQRNIDVKAADRIVALEHELAMARTRVRDAGKRAEAAETESAARVAEARRDIKSAGRAATKKAGELELALDRIGAEKAMLAERIAGLESDVVALRALAAKRQPVPEPATEELVPPSTDPLSIARHLDHVLTLAQRHHEDPTPTSEPGDPLELPAGLAPDRAEAVAWLLGSGIPQIWVIDGHNLAYRLDADRFTDPDLRVDIADLMAGFRRMARGPLRAVIVFDTGSKVGDRIQPATGVEVTFAGDADEEVVQLAGSFGAEAVVVSSDRDVRHRAEAAGSLVLWSDAVVDFRGG